MSSAATATTAATRQARVEAWWLFMLVTQCYQCAMVTLEKEETRLCGCTSFIN
jgi:hypothetical protein